MWGWLRRQFGRQTGDGPADSASVFVPMRDATGRVTGIMDRATADYLASTRPDPSQRSLDDLLATVNRVRVVAGGMAGGRATGTEVLLDTAESAAVAGFRAAVSIVEDPATFGHCMCYGDPAIEVYAGDRLPAAFGYHHGFAIRWEAWKHDAHLREPEKLIEWLSAHGVPGPREEVDAAARRAEENERAAGRWLAAMPECLRPFWDPSGHRSHDPAFHRELLAALRADRPSPDEQVLALLGWFGSGAGPWSGYPSYESIPEQLLGYFPTAAVVAALTASEPSEAELVGAVRYLSGWTFTRDASGRQARAGMPAELRARLAEAADRTNIPDIRARARWASDPGN